MQKYTKKAIAIICAVLICGCDRQADKADLVVVNGAGEFLRDGKRVSLISASEWYEFDDDEQIIKIYSYCIPEI